MGIPQYAWKQNGAMKRGWFRDKEQCLKHCEQHKSERPVYLYRRVLISHWWFPIIVRSKYQSFRCKVKAHLARRGPHGPDWTLLEDPWFQNPKNCHFKNMLREGYDVANCWGTTHYLVMLRLHGDDHNRQCFLKHLERSTLDLESLDIGKEWLLYCNMCSCSSKNKW
jgi:hypothetical protein